MMNSEESPRLKVQILSVVFLAVSWIAVALRCYVRQWIQRAFRMDDWLMLLSVILFSIYTVFNLVATKFGLGQHDVAIGIQDQIQGHKWSTIAALTYILIMAVTKCSIATFLLRIAADKTYRLTIYILMVMVIIYSLVIFFYNVFLCHPVEFSWDHTIEGGSCAPDALGSSYTLSALAIVSDFLFALLPVPLIWSLKLNMTTKISAFAVLSFGIFASAATIARLGTLINIDMRSDYLYNIVDTITWTTIEISLSIIGGSVATLRPLLKALKIKGFSTSRSNAGAIYRHMERSLSIPLGAFRGHSDLALRNGNPVDAESRLENDVVITSEVSDAISRTGSEERILTEGEIKVTTGVTVTHL